jgi:DNA-binding transcriptional ArsR family regulator
MPAPLEDLITVDRLVHEPARFAILTALSACRKADFRFLQSITGLPQGNLSGHLARLEAGGLVAIEKRFKGKYPQTWIRITTAGRSAFERHWGRLEASRKQARAWRAWRERRPATAE